MTEYLAPRYVDRCHINLPTHCPCPMSLYLSQLTSFAYPRRATKTCPLDRTPNHRIDIKQLLRHDLST